MGSQIKLKWTVLGHFIRAMVHFYTFDACASGSLNPITFSPNCEEICAVHISQMATDPRKWCWKFKLYNPFLPIQNPTRGHYKYSEI